MTNKIHYSWTEVPRIPSDSCGCPIGFRSPKGLGAATIRVARRQPWAYLKAIFTMSPYRNIATPDLCRKMLFSPEMPAKELNICHDRMQDESYQAYLDMMFLDLPRHKPVQTPVLVLGGERDMAISKDEVESTAAAYNTQAETFPGIAHDIMLETGWWTVADRIIGWLGDHEL